MAWTYSGNPLNSSLDGVRYLIQDTNIQDQQLQDAEILASISWYPNIWRAASHAASIIASKYARQVDKSVGDLKLSYSQRQKAYADMAADLKNQAANKNAIPYASGISKADERQDVLNPDIKQPTFTKHQFHYPQGSNGTNTDGTWPDDEQG